ncbi:MAG: dihydrolipoyl dehydrogenase [Deltaproteobacteria bacterium]|nr:dihydrolipoyl dehydrogenase [Deltaproteobacteria bacterium]
MANYDVIIIGAGPGGYVAAIRAAKNGLKTAVVEQEKRLGGTCLLRGCIPTKALLHAADVLTVVKSAKDIGIDVELKGIDFQKVQKSRSKAIQKSAAGVSYLMKQNNIEVLVGHGELVNEHEVVVHDTTSEKQNHQAQHIIIATGSRPQQLSFLKVDGHQIVTSDEILELTAIPKSLLVLGAGAVGIEFASLFKRLGSSEVTVIEMLNHILPLEDEEVSFELEHALTKRGIKILTKAKLEKAEVVGDEVHAQVALKEGEPQLLKAEMLLVAVGRTPQTQNLGLDNVNIKTDKAGYIEVDEFMRTSVRNIYAIGDIVRTIALAHVASAEGILAADHAAHKHCYPLKYNQMPSAVYAQPEVASVGLSEHAAREAGYDVKVAKFPFAASGKARILGQTEGFIKIVGEQKYGEVLGVHIIGPHATELISEAGVGLRLEITSEELAQVVHAHPTISEVVAEAAHILNGQALHI